MMRQPSPPGAGDDLTRIKGIKDTRQQLLRDALGIRTFSDLASAAPERIFAAFRAQAQPISRATIEQWIEQARVLMIAPDEPTDDESPMFTSPHEWRAIAQFGVIIQERRSPTGGLKYRTNAYHQEVDEDQHWMGVALVDALAWIDERIDPAWRAEEQTLLQPSSEIAPETAPMPAMIPAPSVQNTSLVIAHERLQVLIEKTERILSAPLPPATPPAAPYSLERGTSRAQSAAEEIAAPSGLAPHDRFRHYLERIAEEQDAIRPTATKREGEAVGVQSNEVATGVRNERLRGLLLKHSWG